MRFSSEIFFDYNNKLEKIINNGETKIYLLDVKGPSIDGIQVAKKIRGVDSRSQIIFLSAIEAAIKEILFMELMVLTFISKNENCFDRLYNAVDKALFLLDWEEKVFIKSGGITYQILLDDINYIYRDTFTRKSVIVGDNICIKSNKPLCYFEVSYRPFFKKTHRACLVNMKKVISFDFQKNIIVFKNGEKCTLLSKGFKSEKHI